MPVASRYIFWPKPQCIARARAHTHVHCVQVLILDVQHQRFWVAAPEEYGHYLIHAIADCYCQPKPASAPLALKIWADRPDW
jgi:hypothetical protein